MMYRKLGSVFGVFARSFALSAVICAAAFGGCKGKDKNGYIDRNTVPNPHPYLFSKTVNHEDGLTEGNFPLMYGIYANNVNNSSGYVDMATILDRLEFFEEPSGFKFVDGDLHIRIEVTHPSRAHGLADSGGPKTPDYIGVISPSNKSGIINFSGMSDYATVQLAPQDAFNHAGYFFNAPNLPIELDPLKPPPRIQNNFDPLNPANTVVERVNYGNRSPQTVQLPTGDDVEVELFVEWVSGKKQVVDFEGDADRVAIDVFRKQPFFDPTTLDASYTRPVTRASVDSALFQAMK